MIYFSELKGKKVVTDKGKIIGYVNDCLFLAADAPLVTKFVIKTQKNKQFIVPVRYIKGINDAVSLTEDYELVEQDENELSMVKHLLDKQIIDVKGGKVVRVNDIPIQDKEDKTEYYISGVDIGFRAVLRWIGLEKPVLPLYRLFRIYSHPHFLSWADIEPLELTRGNVQLKKAETDLERMRPEDLADYLEKTNIRNVNKIVTTLDEEYAADVIGDLNVNYQTALFRRFAPERAAKLIEYLDPDEAVDILLTLPRDKRDLILDVVPKGKKKALQDLMRYSKTPIGELVDPELIFVYPDDTIGTAIEKVKKYATESHFVDYIYVVNESRQLQGVFGVTELLAQPTDMPVFKIMEQDVIVIHLSTPKEIAIKKLLKYKLTAIPVIENNKEVIGTVSLDDMVETIIEKL